MQSIIEWPTSHANKYIGLEMRQPSFSMEEMLNRNETDNYTMRNVQQRLLQSVKEDDNTEAHEKRENMMLVKKPKEQFPSNHFTDQEARDSNGQNFRKSSTKYGYVKSKVDSNLRNKHRPASHKKHEERYNDQKEVLSNLTATEENERVQANVVWRNNMTMLPNSFRSRSYSASPHIQHVTTDNQVIEPMKSSHLPARSKSATRIEHQNEKTFSRLMPSDFDSYIQLTTSFKDYKNATDTMRTYQSYISQKRNKGDSRGDSEDVFLKNSQIIENYPRQYNEGHDANNNLYYMAPNLAGHQPVAVVMPTFSLPHTPHQLASTLQQRYQNSIDANIFSQSFPLLKTDKRIPNRPISEHYTSSSTRRVFDNDNKKELLRPASERHGSKNTSENALRTLSYSSNAFNALRSNDPQPLARQVPQQEKKYADTFDYLKNDYLKENNNHRLEFAQQKESTSVALSRQAATVLERLQEQQHQNNQENKRTQEQQRLQFNANIKKAELTLAENMKFLHQLQYNKSLPPIPPSKTTPSSSQPHKTSPTDGKYKKLPELKSSLKEKNGLLSSSLPSYLNYTNVIFGEDKKGSKTPNILKKKKSVRIALEKNQLHYYTPDEI